MSLHIEKTIVQTCLSDKWFSDWSMVRNGLAADAKPCVKEEDVNHHAEYQLVNNNINTKMIA